MRALAGSVSWPVKIFLAALLVAPPCLVWLAIEDTPVVLESKPLERGDVARSRELAKHTIKELLSGKTAVTLTYTEEELNGMMAMISRGIPEVSGRASTSSMGLEAALSYRLARGPFDGYINVRAGLAPSGPGIAVRHLRVGRIRVPGGLALGISRVLADLVLGDRQGTLFLEAIERLEFSDEGAVVQMQLPSDLRSRLELTRERLEGLRDEVGLLGDPTLVRAYYEHLILTEALAASETEVSLGRYVGAIFDHAWHRSHEGDPVTENRAALLALAIYLGDARFESLVGRVRDGSLESFSRPRRSVLLGRRHDLRLHFVISAGLQIAADSGVSYAIGEFKELMDAGKGGSGYSFADLAADRAGVRFAQAATDPSGGARRLQKALAGRHDERLFFPFVGDLPEGIAETDLEAAYGGVDGAGYRAMVDRIDSRIEQLPIYRG